MVGAVTDTGHPQRPPCERGLAKIGSSQPIFDWGILLVNPSTASRSRRLRATRSAAQTVHRTVIHYRRLRFTYPLTREALLNRNLSRQKTGECSPVFVYLLSDCGRMYAGELFPSPLLFASYRCTDGDTLDSFGSGFSIRRHGWFPVLLLSMGSLAPILRFIRRCLWKNL